MICKETYIGRLFMYQNDASNYISVREMQLLEIVRRLWIEHVMWTRSFIISAAESLPDLNAVTSRLLRNPKDFADALRPLYGERIAQTFDSLLSQHLLIAADLVKAAKSGDSRAAAQKRADWYANADSIANFLAGINPFWNSETWRILLYDHLKMTEDEAMQILQGRFAESIAQYDAIQGKALKMADEMGNGIIKQLKL
jgi:hypothetical protein